MGRDARTRVRQWRRAVDEGRVDPADDYWATQASMHGGQRSDGDDESRKGLTDYTDARTIDHSDVFDGETYHRFQLVVQTVTSVGLFDGGNVENDWIAYPEGDTLRLLSTDFDETRRLSADEVDSDEYVPQTTTDGTPIWAY